ncbi:MAG: 2-C-methyl-D-erythritol 2,4-cyclodiphosphate synthase [Pirellulaceae bacterium]|nr:2-C-methyl-D-erythritol 2,4-cyclodiphosphate synthase [Pirellulaceae bacterium]
MRAGKYGPTTEDAATSTLRIGIGHDTHRLAEGGPLTLGGVRIEHDQGLVGHSDADVLLHAVTDALLGAAALGDIGQWFPDTDARHQGRDSAEMLSQVAEAIAELGYSIVNLDCIVFAERPRLRPHADAIQRRIAGVLGIAPQQVGLKAKTGEAVGPVGRREAIMAQCVVLLERSADSRPVAAETPDPS